MLVRCLYASHATSAGPEAAEAILAEARRRNPAHGITGILCHGEGLFIQVLEGGRDAIAALLGLLHHDPRHRGLCILVHEEIAERRFGHWAMGQVEIGRINHALLLKYSATQLLDPFTMPGCSTMSLIEELRASAAIVGRAG